MYRVARPIPPFRQPDYFNFGKVFKAVVTGGASLIADKAKSGGATATRAEQQVQQIGAQTVQAQQDQIAAQEKLKQMQQINNDLQAKLTDQLASLKQIQTQSTEPPANNKNMLLAVIGVLVVIGLVFIIKNKK